MKIFNSLTAKKEIFKPKNENEITIYVCGLTPYDDVHIGHARTFINFDVIVKFFKFLGFKVRYIRNCLLYTSPSPRDPNRSRMPSSA